MTSYGPRIWFPCSHSIFFQIFICFSIRFEFVLVFVVFQNLFEYLYSFSIASCFSFSCSNILLHFYSVLVLVIVTKISQSIAILFYALVYDDDDDDAGLSSGAGTNLKVEGTCQASLSSYSFTPESIIKQPFNLNA